MPKTNYREPEENDDFLNADHQDINPLDESVNEKAYARPNINVDADTLNQPIPEPSFAPPPMDFSKPPVDEEKLKAKKEPMNPEMVGLSNKEKDAANDVLADMVLDMYGLAHVLANRSLMISEKKLIKLQQEGEINLNAQIEYEYGKKITAGLFFEQYNRQAEGTLSVSDEFKEEVKPVLKKVLAKNGLGMTPEQQLGYLFAKDIAGKAIIVVSMKSQLSQMMEVIKNATTGQPSYPSPPQGQNNAAAEQKQEKASEPEKNDVDSPIYEDAEVVKGNGSKGVKPKITINVPIPPKGKRGSKRKI